MTHLVWFRADLRTKDNPALFHAIQQALGDAKQSPATSPVVAAFIVSASDYKNHDVSACKVDFMLRNLFLLSADLWKRFRIPLVVRETSEKATAVDVVHQLTQQFKVTDVYFNNEYEVNESRRDQRITELATAQWNVKIHRFNDQCVVLPGLLRSKSGEGNVYTVFTPFKKAWYQKVYTNSREYLRQFDAEFFLKEGGPVNAETALKSLNITGPDAVPEAVQGFEITDKTYRETLLKLWPAGETAAQERLNRFAQSRLIDEYDDQRNMLANEEGTSGLSTYLASGVLSTKQCLLQALAYNGQKLDSGKKGVVTWISELVWRDFYRHILVAYPRVCMNKPFKLATMTLPWRYEKVEFQAWCTGRTGYPVVDAGMRQLLATGWIHNRARMIVASFLTKHLLHNWQLGEKFFMQHQIDGDFASNNGGWQWSASTGTDAQPYFRVFNPTSQAEKFDPKGDYIRRWVPELRSVKNAAALHDPMGVLGKKEIERLGYVTPIVAHELGRNRAIQAFKQNADRTKKEQAQESDSSDDDVKEEPAAAKSKKKGSNKRQRKD